MWKKKSLPKVPIEIEGRKRHLLLDWQAMATFEVHTGKPILDPATLQGMTVRDTLVLFWACLRHYDETLPSEWVVHLLERIDESKVEEIGKTLGELWQKTMAYLIGITG